MTDKNEYQEKKQRNMVAYVFLTFLAVLLLEIYISVWRRHA